MFEYLVAGGPVMVPIALCSVVALAAFLERMWALRRVRVVPDAFVSEVVETLRQGRPDEALVRCRGQVSVAARLLGAAIEQRGDDRARRKERLEEMGRREAAELERGVAILGTVASIAPLLGLLGTVGGMIVTFEVIDVQGLGNVSSLAGGISQALITTFAGLCVAIPALVANRYVLGRIDGMLLDLEELVSVALDLLDPKELAP